jgi:uncharacterized protein (TIGR02453 family)
VAVATEGGTRETPPFGGFPPELFAFLEGLEKDNSKTYWEANRATWEEHVQEPVRQLMADLEEEFGPLRTFRPHRDVRFSKDKSPYKTWVGVTTSERAVGGVGAFLRLDADGMRLAGGSMAMAPDQIQQFRSAIDNEESAAEFEKIRRLLAEKSLPIGPGRQPPLKRTPTGYPSDHPRAELLRWKGAVVIKEYELASWMHQPQAIDNVREVWTATKPLTEWIDQYVGESHVPPRRRGD